jgi:hypothetical protein
MFKKFFGLMLSQRFQFNLGLPQAMNVGLLPMGLNGFIPRHLVRSDHRHLVQTLVDDSLNDQAKGLCIRWIYGLSLSLIKAKEEGPVEARKAAKIHDSFLAKFVDII